MKVMLKILFIIFCVNISQVMASVVDDIKNTAKIFSGTTVIVGAYTLAHLRAANYFSSQSAAISWRKNKLNLGLYVLRNSLAPSLIVTTAARCGGGPHSSLGDVVLPLSLTSVFMGSTSYYMKESLNTKDVYKLGALATMGVAGYIFYKRY